MEFLTRKCVSQNSIVLLINYRMETLTFNKVNSDHSLVYSQFILLINYRMETLTFNKVISDHSLVYSQF